MLVKTSRGVATALAFASAAWRYWLGVFPVARHEMCCLRHCARCVTAGGSRPIALRNLSIEAGNLEGAAAFTAFVPRAYRDSVVRAQVAFQAVYDYVDSLAEQPRARSATNAQRLHCALLVALSPSAPHLDYYAHHLAREDNGYLVRLVDTCRCAASRLPSFGLAADAARANVQRIIAYQSRVNLTAQGHPEFVQWASRETPAGADLRWWETGAACGSSLTVFAMLAAAADPRLTRSAVKRIEAIYWPWTGALHTLLDSLIDHREDQVTGQHSLVTHYASPQDMAGRVQHIATEALRRADSVGTEHRLIIAGMVSLYLSDRRAWRPDARLASESVLGALGGLATPAMSVQRVRRRLSNSR